MIWYYCGFYIFLIVLVSPHSTLVFMVSFCFPYSDKYGGPEKIWWFWMRIKKSPETIIQFIMLGFLLSYIGINYVPNLFPFSCLPFSYYYGTDNLNFQGYNLAVCITCVVHLLSVAFGYWKIMIYIWSAFLICSFLFSSNFGRVWVQAFSLLSSFPFCFYHICLESGIYVKRKRLKEK